MFGLLNRSSRARKPTSPPPVRLGLERLEDRVCPAGPFLVGGAGVAAPESLSLNVTYDANRQVTLAGYLTSAGYPVGNESINFGGVVSGTTTTNAMGAYSVTLPVSQLGQVTAASADGLSNTQLYTLVSGTPTITNFQAVSLGDGLWRFSGMVSNAPAQGEVVDFGGINALKGQQITVHGDGTFTFYCTVLSGQGGWATADAVDWWGDESTQAMTPVNC